VVGRLVEFGGVRWSSVEFLNPPDSAGVVQLVGRGDCSIADLGKWRGRAPSADEWEMLRQCGCPACQQYGLDGLRASKIAGFSNRATHNLWTLLEEARLIQHYLSAGTYEHWYQGRFDNSTYRPLIDIALEMSITPTLSNKM
jgi:7-cyano-7-deazaguanine tRNA-ribosyltransferase